MAKDVDLEFLRQEYFHLQSTVESFDEKALTIKAWSVTLSMVGIGAAFTAKLPLLLLLSAGASLLFWIVEGSWKTFQQANYFRLRKIENYMQGKATIEEDFSVPYITHAWSLGWREVRLSKVMSWPHVFLPHAIVVMTGITLWIINSFVRIVPL
ncbi:hypothetical protein [Methylomonas sp. 11b]|jgi:hypothetical protein|uniref:hypothetical protein n=1 Tax=Methylomonas sp. 11b TaxID=1168169 RepID=UPI00056D5842|nr:hypothetical protein [Methylomonas sp. 11b]OQW72964.1 MAG: hypothetical protein BVN35_13025 [Proteobacteria bacterium ST_bin11]